MPAIEKLAVFVLLCGSVANCFEYFDLWGNWTVTDDDELSLPATVPGGIYSDLMNNKIIGDVFHGTNDVDTRWVSLKNWTYSTTFTVNDTLMNHAKINIVFDGIDTFASISVNQKPIGNTDNMFVRYIFNIKDAVELGSNTLEIHFVSPVQMASKLFDIQAQNYIVPPECVPPQYQGECHVNHIRKMQASFSWDWGPAFPSMGIWKPVYIQAFNSAVIRDVTVNISSNTQEDSWDIIVNTYLGGDFSGTITGSLTIRLNTDIDDMLNVYEIEVTNNENGEYLHTAMFSIPKLHVKLWWPNGYGNAELYQMKVTFLNDDRDEGSVKNFRVGFRTVSLVQSSVNGNDTEGMSFYFVVNNIPIFAKGSNSIPVNVLPERGQDSSTIRFLLKSAQAVHMNMIRVWGGGIYESDEFYEVADELGILVWQDFMFACAMYPVNEDFLNSVIEEVKHQVRRLQHHPSILLWAANNENEAALRQNWYGTASNFDLYKSDYVKLYVETIRTEVSKNDPSRQFLTSSPTNGIKSELEGYVAENPASSLFGDIHYYNYFSDSWDQSIYPIPRFASEYGLQSLPILSTLETAVDNISDVNIFTNFMSHRQHHPGGNAEMVNLISTQLPLPAETHPNFYKAFIYYSQIQQAVGIKLQTEFYRTWRSTVNNNNQGLTMGALYWQLNDVWVAPTWSGIDFNNNWKMLHYYAKDFFSPVIISGQLSASRVFGVRFVSDLLTNIYGATATIKVFMWNSTSPIHTENHTVDVMSGVMGEINSTYWVDAYLEDAGCGNINLSRYVCFLHLSLTDNQSISIAPYNFIFPAPLKDSYLRTPRLSINSVEQIDVDGYKFLIEILTDEIALFVWLEAKDTRGVFSENGFIQVANRKTVEYYSETRITVNDLASSVIVTNLMDSEYS